MLYQKSILFRLGLFINQILNLAFYVDFSYRMTNISFLLFGREFLIPKKEQMRLAPETFSGGTKLHSLLSRKRLQIKC